MAPKASKKSQAELISLVKSAGWKEDQKTQAGVALVAPADAGDLLHAAFGPDVPHAP